MESAYLSQGIEAPEFVSGVGAALHGTIYVSSRIYHGDALYADFLADRPGQPEPDSWLLGAEVGTFYATWEIRSGGRVICRQFVDDTQTLKAAVQNLERRAVERVMVDMVTWELELRLSGGWILSVTPWGIEDVGAEDMDANAWYVRVRNKYLIVDCNGDLTVQVHTAHSKSPNKERIPNA